MKLAVPLANDGTIDPSAGIELAPKIMFFEIASDYRINGMNIVDPPKSSLENFAAFLQKNDTAWCLCASASSLAKNILAKEKIILVDHFSGDPIDAAGAFLMKLIREEQ